MMFNPELGTLESYFVLDKYGMEPVEAAAKWLSENPEKEKEWLVEWRYPKVAD
jgi:ABC-type proline/glycine betaine transport system substrate-binding protein